MDHWNYGHQHLNSGQIVCYANPQCLTLFANRCELTFGSNQHIFRKSASKPRIPEQQLLNNDTNYGYLLKTWKMLKDLKQPKMVRFSSFFGSKQLKI